MRFWGEFDKHVLQILLQTPSYSWWDAVLLSGQRTQGDWQKPHHMLNTDSDIFIKWPFDQWIENDKIIGVSHRKNWLILWRGKFLFVLVKAELCIPGKKLLKKVHINEFIFVVEVADNFMLSKQRKYAISLSWCGVLSEKVFK